MGRAFAAFDPADDVMLMKSKLINAGFHFTCHMKYSDTRQWPTSTNEAGDS
jgi:hypothetical protein